MLKRMVPRRVKLHLHLQFKKMLMSHLLSADASERVKQIANFHPHLPENNSYTLPAYPAAGEPRTTSRFPVPPSSMWVAYGTSDQEYLESGRVDIANMRRIFEQAGSRIETAERILEFGCAAGRCVRWLDDLAVSREIWGVDTWASAILWCKEQLSPPFHFATTSVSPHLPFEDRYFDVIYAGSVFTHIDDMTDAWFLELRRILRPGGKLYFTLMDRRTVAVLEGQRTTEELELYYKYVGGKDRWDRYMEGDLRSSPEYQIFKRQQAYMMTISRSTIRRVMWDAEALCKRQEPFYRMLSVTEKAYGFQTAVLWERV